MHIKKEPRTQIVEEYRGLTPPLFLVHSMEVEIAPSSTGFLRLASYSVTSHVRRPWFITRNISYSFSQLHSYASLAFRVYEAPFLPNEDGKVVKRTLKKRVRQETDVSINVLNVRLIDVDHSVPITR